MLQPNIGARSTGFGSECSCAPRASVFHRGLEVQQCGAHLSCFRMCHRPMIKSVIGRKRGTGLFRCFQSQIEEANGALRSMLRKLNGAQSMKDEGEVRTPEHFGKPECLEQSFLGFV